MMNWARVFFLLATVNVLAEEQHGEAGSVERVINLQQELDARRSLADSCTCNGYDMTEDGYTLGGATNNDLVFLKATLPFGFCQYSIPGVGKFCSVSATCLAGGVPPTPCLSMSTPTGCAPTGSLIYTVNLAGTPYGVGFVMPNPSVAATWCTAVTKSPSRNPTVPSNAPSKNPSRNPTQPTTTPTRNPSRNPTNPSLRPTLNPTRLPTRNPTLKPTSFPSQNPSLPGALPTEKPSRNPTRKPSRNPSINPTKKPSRNPTSNPTRYPSLNPTSPTAPSLSPTKFIPPTVPPKNTSTFNVQPPTSSAVTVFVHSAVLACTVALVALF